MLHAVQAPAPQPAGNIRFLPTSPYRACCQTLAHHRHHPACRLSLPAALAGSRAVTQARQRLAEADAYMAGNAAACGPSAYRQIAQLADVLRTQLATIDAQAEGRSQ